MGEAHHGHRYSSPFTTPEHVSFCVQKQFNLLYLKRILTKVLHGRYASRVPVRLRGDLRRLHLGQVVSPRFEERVGKQEVTQKEEESRRPGCEHPGVGNQRVILAGI